MKKILFVLLIAVIFCKIELDYVSQDLTDNIDMDWERVKNNFDSAVEFLKLIDLYDPFVALIRTDNRYLAYLYCEDISSSPDYTCRSMVEFVVNGIKTHKI